MEDVDFEAEFADELEAMNELEVDGGHLSPSCKPKRSLNFPITPGRETSLNQSLEPLNDSDDHNNNSENNGTIVEKGESTTCIDSDDRKRKNTGDGESTSNAAKRQKIDNPFLDVDFAGLDDEWDVTPPSSPKLAPVPKPKPRVQNTLDLINDRLMRDYDYDRPRVLRRIPAADFVSVTADDGRRFYVGVQTEMQRVMKVNEKLDSAKPVNLLSLPYRELKERVLEQRRQALEEATSRAITNLDSELNDTETNSGVKALWVERYTPKAYTDLLSDESTNRTLLHWLKLWDHVVFGRELKKKLPKKEVKKSDRFQKKDFRKEQLDMEMELDSLKRPFHKIVLLCGNPGLGKTTLAHVLAQHAGYKVIEINASDDRSAETFKNKIDAAIQMKAVLGSDPRPNCLIIDEIDGAPQPAINQLLAIIKGGNEAEDPKKNKKKQAPLMRPIICICNDQYAPSLRQLRQQALLLSFPQTLPIKLAGRLLEICQREGLKADQSTLLVLCNKTDNDIRSCINTLQFFRAKKCDLMLRDIQSASFAQKDFQKGLFVVWQAIFQRPKQNKRQYVNPYDRSGMSMQEMIKLQNEQNNTSASWRFQNVHNLASTTGEYDKVIMGMFENFLNQNIKDPRLDGVNLAASWLCHVDVMNTRVGRTQDYSTYPYIPFVMVLFHLLFAANQVNKLQFPHFSADCRQRLTSARALVSSLMDDMSTRVRHYVNETSMVLDVLPPLMDIIQPSFRPINTQLYSAREKADLSQLIRIMVEYNLTYRQDKAQDGHYTYVLEPQVDQVVKFPGLKQRKQMTYAAKQLVAREVDLEKMRRAEIHTNATSLPAKPANSKEQSDKQANVKTNEIPNHMQKLQPKQIVEKELVTKDFFGRKIDSNAAPTVSKKKKSVDDGSDLLSRDVWYHFKEGFSNAVRKTVRIQDLL